MFVLLVDKAWLLKTDLIYLPSTLLSFELVLSNLVRIANTKQLSKFDKVAIAVDYIQNELRNVTNTSEIYFYLFVIIQLACK